VEVTERMGRRLSATGGRWTDVQCGSGKNGERTPPGGGL